MHAHNKPECAVELWLAEAEYNDSECSQKVEGPLGHAERAARKKKRSMTGALMVELTEPDERAEVAHEQQCRRNQCCKEIK